MCQILGMNIFSCFVVCFTSLQNFLKARQEDLPHLRKEYLMTVSMSCEFGEGFGCVVLMKERKSK